MFTYGLQCRVSAVITGVYVTKVTMRLISHLMKKAYKVYKHFITTYHDTNSHFCLKLSSSNTCSSPVVVIEGSVKSSSSNCPFKGFMFFCQCFKFFPSVGGEKDIHSLMTC